MHMFNDTWLHVRLMMNAENTERFARTLE